MIKLQGNMGDVKLTKREGGGFKVIIDVGEDQTDQCVYLMKLAVKSAPIVIAIEEL